MEETLLERADEQTLRTWIKELDGQAVKLTDNRPQVFEVRDNVTETGGIRCIELYVSGRP